MKHIKYILLLLIMTTFVACELEDSSIDGDDLTGGTSSKIFGWNKTKIAEYYFEDEGTISKQYPIRILAGGTNELADNDVTFNISVVEDETTATDEYSIPKMSGIISKGEEIGYFDIDINTGNFSPDEPTILVLDITTANGAILSDKSKRVTITFVGCLSDLSSYTYNVRIVRENTGAVYEGVAEPLTENGVNYFQTFTVGTWPLDPGVRFTDTCGVLTIESHSLMDYYSNQVTAVRDDGVAGVVDENGNFELYYNISLGDWGNYKATYTKN